VNLDSFSENSKDQIAEFAVVLISTDLKRRGRNGRKHGSMRGRMDTRRRQTSWSEPMHVQMGHPILSPPQGCPCFAGTRLGYRHHPQQVVD
jgi:hypothetical protein